MIIIKKNSIVAVHGMNGHPHNTWTTKSGVFWLHDLLPKLGPKKARVLVYGYNSRVTSFADDVSTDGIIQHAENLASDLSANRSVSLFHDMHSMSKKVTYLLPF